MTEELREIEEAEALLEECYQVRDELFLNGEVSIEESNSYDPSWNIVFSDGSKGYLGNPYQRAFEAFFLAC